MKFCSIVRRRKRARILAKACAVALNDDTASTLAGIILGERSAAWDALADGDAGMALKHLVEARWFAKQSPAAHAVALAAMKEAAHVVA